MTNVASRKDSWRRSLVKLMKVFSMIIFLAAVPWAMHYNLNYDRYGAIDRPTPPVFIQIVTVNAGVFNNTLKAKAAEYASRNHGVRIFVLPLTAEQVGAQEFDVRIIRDGLSVHAFISQAQTPHAVEHCQNFLHKIAQENETFQINIR